MRLVPFAPPGPRGRLCIAWRGFSSSECDQSVALGFSETPTADNPTSYTPPLAVMQAECIDQSPVTQLLKSDAHVWMEQYGIFPRCWIMHIAGFWSDIEIAAQRQRLRRIAMAFEIGAQAADPVQFVDKFITTDNLPVWNVYTDDARPVDEGAEEPRLSFVLTIVETANDFLGSYTRKNGDAVICSLTRKAEYISQAFKFLSGERIITDFCFLETQDIRPLHCQPSQDTLLTGANGIHVPGGDTHGLATREDISRREYNSAG